MEIKNVDFKALDAKNLSALICQYLMDKGINVVLTGGACVIIFSKNIYVSKDLDFVPEDIDLMPKITKVLEDIKFTKKGRHYIRDGCPFLIEFVNPPLAIGGEKVAKIDKIKTEYGLLNLLSPTDCVKDRLAAYFHWEDLQSLEQALMVAAKQKIDLKELERWSKAEGFSGKYNDFLEQLKKK